MKRLIREPLIHFLFLGAALFGLYAALNPNPASSQDDVVVTAGQIENLASTFEKLWQRPPTEAELKGQIDEFVKEEILSREAIALGLDRNDTVIRRRLQQKMEFIAEDFSTANEPTDTELANYLATHPDVFREEQRFSFRQVFLSRDKRGDRLEADATGLLKQLRQGAAAELRTLGDTSLLPSEFIDEPERGVASQFGEGFAAALIGMKPGQWSGPIESGYGVHLVFLMSHTEGRLPELDDIRDQVARELLNDRRLAANREFFDALLTKYRVTIAWPGSDRTQTDSQHQQR